MKWTKVRDAIIWLIVIALIIWASVCFFQSGSFSVSGMMGEWGVVLLSFFGIVDLCKRFGCGVIIPTQLETRGKETDPRSLMSAYYAEHLDYIQKNEEVQIDYILNQLNLTRVELNEFRLKIIEVQTRDFSSIDDVRERLREIISLPPVVIKQDFDSSKRGYSEVRNYIDFVASSNSRDALETLGAIFCTFIRMRLEERGRCIDGIDRLVIPYDSNFRLLMYVSEELRKPFVIMRANKGRVYANQPWDGTIRTGETLLVIHDVFVTGRQVVESVNKVNQGQRCEIVGVYCLVRRKEYAGQKTSPEVRALESNCSIESLVDIKDEDIDELLRAI